MVAPTVEGAPLRTLVAMAELLLMRKRIARASQTSSHRSEWAPGARWQKSLSDLRGGVSFSRQRTAREAGRC